MESWSLPSSISYFAEIGLPALALAVSPRCRGNVVALRALARSACSFSWGVCAQVAGSAKSPAANNVNPIAIVLMVCLQGLKVVRITSLHDCALTVTRDTTTVKRYTPCPALIFLKGRRRTRRVGFIKTGVALPGRSSLGHTGQHAIGTTPRLERAQNGAAKNVKGLSRRCAGVLADTAEAKEACE